MSGLEKIQRAYAVSVRQPGKGEDVYHVSYVPRGWRYAEGTGGKPAQPPEFIASIRFQGDDGTVSWNKSPSDLEATPEDFTQDARGRVRTLRAWIGRLADLVSAVEGYAKDLGWVTCRIDKKMEDSQIGRYEAPGLLMQERAYRVLLEPVGRSAPGVEGIVDLYLMPAYDDIASLYYYDGRWNLHYIFPGMTGVANTREAPAKPLAKESLQEVLEQMKKGTWLP